MDKERLFRYLDRKYSSKSEIIPNIPLGENADVIWAEILHSRRERSIELPLVNVNGDAYWYILTRKMISASEVIVEELLEQENTAEPHTSSVSTIEEIYYTGFMEGAQISVQDAMKFLQSGEEPESVEELILLNSRQAAGFAAENMYHAIDSNYLHNLAYFLTEGLDNGSGDFRMTDNIEIPSMQGESVQLPPAAMLPEQTERFADFLTTTGTHPLIKAAVAQAWVLAYRPFPEGNERLARLLSNVILIRAGYGFFGNISISSILAQTSYEYFRAIANILRVENGADLTYFLEYYLVTLSSAVNELKARKQHQADTVIEAEQQMAAEPLSATQKVVSDEKVAKNKGNPVILNKHRHNAEMVDAALDELRGQGYEQFTLHDLEAITGINRKYISKLLLPYEASEQIIAVRKSKVGNIYAFRQSEQPEDETPDTCAQDEPADMDTDFKEYVISALKFKSREGLGAAKDVAQALLNLIYSGQYRFTTFEIAHNLHISTVSARNSIHYYLTHGMIRHAVNKTRRQFFEFSFVPGTVDEQAADSALPGELSDEAQQELSGVEYTMSELRKIADNNGTRTGMVAEIFIRYLQEDKLTFKTEEISKETGLDNDMIHNALRPFRVKRLIRNTRTGSDEFHGFHVYRFVIDEKQEEQNIGYSDAIMNLIAELENSGSSQKDRRIARIIRKCLAKGNVTKDDYSAEGELSKWNVDMRFAAQLGLLEKVSSREYMIRTEIDPSGMKLRSAQKYTLSALYDIFGDGLFSADMVVAQLDYSSSHVSGILHQFTMLKLLDCTANDDNTYSYQLNVNPTDNPECFEDVA
ncbi:MAG TPA: Fic family protein [Ruminococcus sp.]|nr:Fic family protein [Ruminococcus sp.]